MDPLGQRKQAVPQAHTAAAHVTTRAASAKVSWDSAESGGHTWNAAATPTKSAVKAAAPVRSKGAVPAWVTEEEPETQMVGKPPSPPPAPVCEPVTPTGGGNDDSPWKHYTTKRQLASLIMAAVEVLCSMPATDVDAKTEYRVASCNTSQQPASHLVGQQCVAAFATNDSASSGISVVYHEGGSTKVERLHTPRHAFMLDGGSDINAICQSEADWLGLKCRAINTTMIAFGGHRCTIRAMAWAVPLVLFAGTQHELRMLVDMYVMPDDQQYKYLLGQPFLAAHGVCAMVDTYWGALLVRPDVGYQEKGYTRQHGEGRRLQLPVNLYGQDKGMQKVYALIKDEPCDSMEVDQPTPLSADDPAGGERGGM